MGNGLKNGFFASKQMNCVNLPQYGGVFQRAANITFDSPRMGGFVIRTTAASILYGSAKHRQHEAAFNEDPEAQ
jgi:hypothetical protein